MSFTEEIKLKILEKLKGSLDPQQYDTWIKGLNFIEDPPGALKIPLPNGFYVEWYKKNYLPIIGRAILEISGKEYAITFAAPPEQGRLFPDDLITKEKKLPTSEMQKTENKNQPGKEQGSREHNFVLNDEYVFDKFVVGTCNRLAHAAALAVAENPGKAYNPLFLHGGVGLGKTHLLQAITHTIVSKHPHYSIYFRSGEEFVNDYITAVKNNTFEKFRNRCRSNDVMIIDDIHFLGRGEKAASQEEFFHTFNALHNSHKQIILSSDSPPKEIPTLQDRLVSRFNWGMVARLESPDFETRMAILRRKADFYKIELPNDVVISIATAVNTNIRDLEGALIRLIGLARSSQQNPSIALATEALKGIAKLPSRQIKIGDIMDVIASYFNLSASELQSKTRVKSVSMARQMGLYVTRQLKPEMSLEEIGAAFGGREHSTVIHSIEKVRKRIQKDSQFKDTLNLLVAEIGRKSV
ncbi:MAG: chromosomal replication initiator protein DnaA [Planctomycetota bacterium]